MMFLGTINGKKKLSCSHDKNETSHQTLKAYGVGTREITNAYKILVKNLKERDHLENLCVDEMTILKWVLNTHCKSVD